MLPSLPPYPRQLIDQPETLLKALNLFRDALAGQTLTDLDVKASLAFQENATAYIISSGAIDLEEGVGVALAHRSAITVDTEGAAASDDLDTINGGRDGLLLILRAANTARTVVVKNGTGNIVLVDDVSLSDNTTLLWLVYSSVLSKWLGFYTIKGDTGVGGAQGDTGVQGDTGIQGDTGSVGLQGDTGVQGLQGDTGVGGGSNAFTWFMT
jgi:hypothetical protein